MTRGPDGLPYHLRVGPDQVGRYVVLPGDPGRVERIAALLEQPRHVMSNREYTTWTGALEGVPVSVVSTGIGGPSTAICVEELCELGVHTLVRAGTCGAMQPGLQIGDLVAVQAAVRDEGTSHQYVPAAWPAVAHVNVVDAVRAAAFDAGARCHIGVVQSKDSFYSEMEPQRMPVAAELTARWEAWIRAGVLASEMECATLFTVAAVRRVRAGAVLSVVNATPAPQAMPAPDALPLDAMLDVAVGAVRRLIEADRAAASARRPAG